MIVTDIKPSGKLKVLVYIDNEKAFSLYKSEVRKYKIKKDDVLEDEIYEHIYSEILPKRCKERVMYILDRGDKSEKEIKDRLTKDGYPREIIDNTIEIFNSAGYVDDLRYATEYIRQKIRKKSLMGIKTYLYNKGIRDEVYETALGFVEDECYEYQDKSLEDIQYECVLNEIQKKVNALIRRNEDIMEELQNDYRRNKDMVKITNSLAGKGFKYDMINTAAAEVVEGLDEAGC